MILQFHTVLESLTDNSAELAVSVMNGVKTDDFHFVGRYLSVVIKDSFVSTDIEDFTDGASGFVIVTDQAAFNGHGQFGNDGGIGKFSFDGGEAGFCQFIGNVVA